MSEFKSFGEYLNHARTLRNDPLIAQWIKDNLKDNRQKKAHPDCMHCGWPHWENIVCASATFGRVRLGGHDYYISLGNVVSMHHFVSKELGGGFHWRNEVFFDLNDGDVVVTRIEPFNNNPLVKRWRIPLREWRSINDFVQAQQANVIQQDAGAEQHD